jgi:hypothetical protein
MSWVLGIFLGALAPWIVRRDALLQAFSTHGARAGFVLWAWICLVTVPAVTAVVALVAVAREFI